MSLRFQQLFTFAFFKVRCSIEAAISSTIKQTHRHDPPESLLLLYFTWVNLSPFIIYSPKFQFLPFSALSFLPLLLYYFLVCVCVYIPLQSFSLSLYLYLSLSFYLSFSLVCCRSFSLFLFFLCYFCTLFISFPFLSSYEMSLNLYLLFPSS
jgi:hypothetical protein